MLKIAKPWYPPFFHLGDTDYLKQGAWSNTLLVYTIRLDGLLVA